MIINFSAPASDEPINFSMPESEHDQSYHVPVLLREVTDFLAPAPGRTIVDCTLGGGGHTEALLAGGATVISLDQDPEAIQFSSQRLGGFLGRFRPVLANFRDVGTVLDGLGVGPVDAALIDAGVSSTQLNNPAKGFSFMHDGPLEMKMSPTGPVSAADIVNTWSAEQLAEIFFRLGEEPGARRVAARIVRDREITPFTRTLQLAECIERVIPKRGRIHPATRYFQAIRMAVNGELEALTDALAALTARLAPGGRIGVISFHSGEDRIVKNFLRDRATEWLDRPEWPAPRRNPQYSLKLLTSRPVVPTEEEQKANPRSRSAKLRVAEKIARHVQPT
jgi:16S rRNA (cytosine1402-N4)-methyltransferase